MSRMVEWGMSGEGQIEVVKAGTCILSSDQQMKAVKADIVWTLYEFSKKLVYSKKFAYAETLCSPEFPIKCGGGLDTRWYLEVNMSKDDVIGLYLFTLEMVDHRVHYQFSLGEAPFELVKNNYDDKPAGRKGYSPHCCWGWENFKRDDLLTSIVKNDQLIVTFSIIIYHAHPDEFRRDMETLSTLFDLQLGDFTIRCDNKDIKVVKEMLIRASPVFEAMFESGMKEAKDGILPIDDLDFDTVQSMLKFTYTGQLAGNMDAAKLIVAANKYQMDHLKGLCSNVLSAGLSVENTSEMLSLGDIHNAPKRLEEWEISGVGQIEVVKVGTCILSSNQQMKAVKADIVWTLDDFSEKLADSKTIAYADSVCSRPFPIKCGRGLDTRWYLEVNMSKEDDIGLYLYSDEMVDHRVHYQFSLGGAPFEVVKSNYDDKPTKCKGDSSSYFYGPYDWGVEDFIKRDELVTSFVKNDQLIVKVSIIIFHAHPEEFRRDMETLSTLFDLQLGDFTIRCDNKDIKVVKELLIKASPVIEAMFESGMKEAVDGVLPIDDLDCDTVQSMLKFAYTGQLADNMDAAKLIIAANKYQMDLLKDLCCNVLIAGLAVENACEMLSLGDVHNAPKLKDAAADLICSKANESVVTEGWQTFLANNTPLVTCLFMKAANRH